MRTRADAQHGRRRSKGSFRYCPPTLIGNLLLKSCDGRRTARQIMSELRMDERRLFEELRLLERTHWISFSAGEDAFRRMAQE